MTKNEIFLTISDKIKELENIEDFASNKFAFLSWAFSINEGVSLDDLEICEEEFPALDISIDGFYFETDSDDIYILVCDYYDEPTNDFYITESRYSSIMRKAKNFIQLSLDKKYKDLDSTSKSFDMADRLYEARNKKEIIIHYYTNMSIPISLIEDYYFEIKHKDYVVNFYGLEEINDFIKNDELSLEINIKQFFGEEIHALQVSSTMDFDVYLFVINGFYLGKLYDNFGVRMLEANVRSYLKKSQKVNKGILETIKDSPQEFLPYNNGLSTIALKGDFTKINGKYFLINNLKEWQIVNGGQTTATIYEALRDNVPLSEVLVPVKLTVLKKQDNTEDLIQSISRYANTQTAVNKSDLSANEPYYIDLQRLSNRLKFNSSYFWFFERTRGQFLTSKRRALSLSKFKNDYPDKYKFNKTDIAKAVVSWQQSPHIVALGKEKNFEYFNNIVRDQLFEIGDEYYYSIIGAIILFRKVDEIVRKQKLEFKANVVAYTISKLSYETSMKIDLSLIGIEQKLSQNLIESIYKMTILVRNQLIKSPPEYKNIPMWARKEECWQGIKDLFIPNLQFLATGKQTNFFPPNEAQIFIKDNKRFENSDIWNKLLMWDDKAKYLTSKQYAFMKTIKANIDMQRNITEKQKRYARDIFIKCIRRGFNYGG